MNKIIIKIFGLGLGNEAQAILILKDDNNEILYEEKTYNGKAEFCLIPNRLYQLLIISKYNRKKIVFYVDNKRCCYCFNIFNDLIPKKVIFQLTDANYFNLPIEKGELVLWLK